MTAQFIIACIFVIMAIIILLGKGDFLIAGYNTATKEEKEQVNIKRLRLIVGLLLLMLAPSLFLLGDDNMVNFIFMAVVVVLTVMAVILSNTWAKKKK